MSLKRKSQITNPINLAILCALLLGCENDNHSTSGKAFNPSDYYAKALDKVVYSFSLSAFDANGVLLGSQTSTFAEYSGETGSIPSKYQYKGNIPGPYTVVVSTEDGLLDGLAYSTSQGTIVDDDLETFTRIDAQIITGTDSPDPSSISVGQQFQYSEQSRLFDSNTAQDVGNDDFSGTLVVSSFETVTVMAGSYNAVKLATNYTHTSSVNNRSSTFTGTGTMWISSANGNPVKMLLEVQDNETGERGSSVQELVSYAAVQQSLDLAIQPSGISAPISLDINSITQSIRTMALRF